MTLTDEVKRLRELEAKAAKGPVLIEGERIEMPVYVYEAYRDIREALPKLLDELERLEAACEEFDTEIGELELKLEGAIDVLKFYAGRSRSEAKRLQVMDGGVLAHTLLKKWGVG